jgi:hypothetical protein
MFEVSDVEDELEPSEVGFESLHQTEQDASKLAKMKSQSGGKGRKMC